jgi:hypothetical protein
MLLSLIVGSAHAGTGNAVLDRLNAQWAAGQPANNLTASGVLVHVFDNMYPGAPGSGSKHPPMQWMPCAADDWCNYVDDRISTSIISKPAGAIFKPSGYKALGGMVMNTGALEDAVLCAWAEDGNTMARRCSPTGNSSSCIPGCYSQAGQPCWCEGGHNECHLERKDSIFDARVKQPSVHHPMEYCPHRPWNMKIALENQVSGHHDYCYNEIVIDAKIFNTSLPKALDAIFYPKGATDDEAARATDVHTNATAFYNKSASELPLLSLDVFAKDTPFECVVCD